MRKHNLIIAFLLIFTVIIFGYPFIVLAEEELIFTSDTTVALDNGLTFTAISGSHCDKMVVYDTYVVFTLSAASGLEIRSNDKYRLDNTLVTPECSDSYSRVVFPVQTSVIDVTVTPIGTTCTLPITTGGGGGGGGGTPSTPVKTTTTTGQVTATASNGGKTTFTTTEGATAIVDLPASAVISSTNITVSTEDKATVASTKPVPSGKNVVGGYVYNLTAVAGGTAVTTFSKDITLTFTYVDSQITGLNEDTLKVYYWDGSKWTALTGTLDKTNNKITVLTNHFSYFVIMGESTIPTMAKPGDYGLKEGDLIRAQGDSDIFIINQNGYKRLFLNPTIFNMYGHLGGWKAVKTITTATRDAFITSHYYRYVDSPKVYQMKVTGEDTGTLHWINMTGENFLAQGGKGEAVFTINKSEFDWYSKGADIISLK